MTREEAIKIVKEFINGTCLHLVDQEALETLISELAESDDERIIRIIKKVVSSANRGDQMMLGNKETSDVLSWLEKQKDLDKMIVVSPEVWDKAIADAYKNGKKDGEKQKEQKPVWSEADKAMIGCIVCCLDGQFVTEAARKQCLEWFNKHRRDFLNQPKQEWSEEDKKRISEIEFAVMQMKTERQDTRDKCLAWLKSLPERFVLQPKREQQIKEGDKVSIHCRKDRREDITITYDGEVGEVIHVWDAKKHPWGHIIVQLNNGCNTGFYEDELEVLDEPSWKPSEEQKIALLDVAYGTYQDEDGPILRELYEQLNKLT